MDYMQGPYNKLSPEFGALVNTLVDVGLVHKSDCTKWVLFAARHQNC